MELVNKLMWVWAISFTIFVIWIKRNPEFIKRIVENDPENMLLFNSQQIELIILIVGFFIAPLVTTIILISELQGFCKFLYYKIKLRLQLRGLKDSEFKRGLREKIKNIKYKF